MKPRERIKKIPNTRPGANMIANVRKDHIGWFGVSPSEAKLAFKEFLSGLSSSPSSKMPIRLSRDDCSESPFRVIPVKGMLSVLNC